MYIYIYTLSTHTSNTRATHEQHTTTQHEHTFSDFTTKSYHLMSRHHTVDSSSAAEDFREVDVSTWKDGVTVTVIWGSSNDDVKMSFLSDFMSRRQDIPTGVIVSRKASSMSRSILREDRFAKDAARHTSTLWLYDAYSPDIMKQLLQHQAHIVERFKKEKRGRQMTDPRAFIILDDCGMQEEEDAASSSWTSGVDMRRAFINGRSHNITMILGLQTPPLRMPRMLCSHNAYVVVGRCDNEDDRMRIYDSYAGCFSTFEDFCRVLDEFACRGEMLVIDNDDAKSLRLEDVIFRYRPRVHDQGSEK